MTLSRRDDQRDAGKVSAEDAASSPQPSTTRSPLRSEAALRDAVLNRLAALEHIAEDGADGGLEARLPLARSELYRLADGWRLLLTVHSAGADGRCRACPGWVRRRRWPCPVWLMAHRHLLGDTLPNGTRLPNWSRLRSRISGRTGGRIGLSRLLAPFGPRARRAPDPTAGRLAEDPEPS
ncbi:MAG TPA: hypothetical protein VHX38_25075 [Pseudonocardiaceae bacterium]|jgi:hypothetical protein|nr:hypothetical protein [Pseudonocardiaceae bacterium]